MMKSILRFFDNNSDELIFMGMVILGFFIIVFQASAMNYFLVPCNDDSSKLCRVGKSPGVPKGAICKVPYIAEGEQVYNVMIKKRPQDFIDRARAAIGFEKEKKWSADEKLAEDEYIECSINETAVEAKKEAKRLFRRSQELADQKKKSDWQKACDKKEIHELICAEHGIQPKEGN